MLGGDSLLMGVYKIGRMQGNAHGKRAPSEDVQGEDGSFHVGSPPPSPRAPGSPLTYRCSSPLTSAEPLLWSALLSLLQCI